MKYNDNYLSYPLTPAFTKRIEITQTLWKLRGINLNLGPELPMLMRNNDCEAIDINISQPVFRTQWQRQYHLLFMQACSEQFEKFNILSINEAARLVDELQEFINDDNRLMAGASLFQVAGKNKTN